MVTVPPLVSPGWRGLVVLVNHCLDPKSRCDSLSFPAPPGIQWFLRVLGWGVGLPECDRIVLVCVDSKHKSWCVWTPNLSWRWLGEVEYCFFHGEQPAAVRAHTRCPRTSSPGLTRVELGPFWERGPRIRSPDTTVFSSTWVLATSSPSPHTLFSRSQSLFSFLKAATLITHGPPGGVVP